MWFIKDTWKSKQERENRSSHDRLTVLVVHSVEGSCVSLIRKRCPRYEYEGVTGPFLDYPCLKKRTHRFNQGLSLFLRTKRDIVLVTLLYEGHRCRVRRGLWEERSRIPSSQCMCHLVRSWTTVLGWGFKRPSSHFVTDMRYVSEWKKKRKNFIDKVVSWPPFSPTPHLFLSRPFERVTIR